MKSTDPRPTTLSELNPKDANFAVAVIELLLPLAIAKGASDVHLQPRREGWEILFRIDGVLSVVQRIAGGGPSDPVTRLMVMAGLPTYRSSQPMEGRIQWSAEKSDLQAVSIRLGVFPTVHGPRAVIRLLRNDERHDQIDALGLADDVAESLAELCEATDGAVLLSGPAGSGKTTTLYAMLRRVAASSPRRSVITIEDPVESVIAGISQSELDVAGGMTLANALRSAVRQDSEVLLVSEIRDPETAEAAMQASLTGHLVFSSLHASDVATSLRRLVQLGVPDYVVRSGVRAIVTQRLLRRRCTDCGGDHPGTATQQCEHCLGSGYRGRFPIAQCIRFDGSDTAGERLADALGAGMSAAQMRMAAANASSVGLRSQAQRCVEQGLTDQAEVYRVLGRE